MKLFNRSNRLNPPGVFIEKCAIIEDQIRITQSLTEMVKLKNTWIRVLLSEYGNNRNCHYWTGRIMDVWEARMDELASTIRIKTGASIINQVIF